MAELSREYEFERSLAVKPINEQPDHFSSVHGPWAYPTLSRVAGSVPLAEATAAAYKTVSEGFVVHCVQCNFLKPGEIGVPLHYEVQRVNTSGGLASRIVLARQTQGGKAVPIAVFIFSFIRTSLTTRGWHTEHEHTVPPSADTIKAAAHQIDPEMDEFHGNARWILPEGTPYPPFSSQRLHATQEPDINSRVLRAKLRINSPLSGPAAQVSAVIFLSDLFVMSTPAHVRGIPYSVPPIGDKTRTFGYNQLKQNVTLTHSLRFVRFEGWDAHEGVLFELKSGWVKDRRGVASIVVRDCKGQLIATGEQEGYYVFKTPEEDKRDRAAWNAKSKGRIGSPKI